MKRKILILPGALYLAALLFILAYLLTPKAPFFYGWPLTLKTAGITFSILLLGLMAFVASSLENPQKRKVLFSSPFGLVKVWLGLFERGETPTPTAGRKPSSWRLAAVETILAAYLYALMEWLFFVTKSSFMDRLALSVKLTIPLLTGFLIAVLGLLALLALFLLNLLLGRIWGWFDNLSRHLPAALLLACLGLVMLDNFTYIVLGFGIVDAKSAIRLLYVVAWLFFILYALHELSKGGGKRWTGYLTLGLLTLSLILAGVTLKSEQSLHNASLPSSQATSHPNIVILSTDGLNASSMSAYGYYRETTPFIAELAKTSLIAENNFTNAGHSMGSDASILTGKLPFETGVLYPPDILTGVDKYQHLPGILKQNGYRTVSLGVKHYVDTNQVNFQNAFDAVNCQANSERGVFDQIASYGYDNAVYMFDTITSRLKERLQHILYIQNMINPFSLVTENSQSKLTDDERLACLRNYMEESKESGQPIFAHVHLMGTHGPYFTLGVTKFSKGEKPDEKWMPDFYDDSVLSYDIQVKEFVEFLKENDLYDNTLLVISTDHGMGWTVTKRLPLIIHFPGDDHAGEISTATQNLDIAPTILDYIGIDKPEWMGGDSLLGELNPSRLLISGKTNMAVFEATDLFMVNEEERVPPFYQFTELTVIQCQRWYRFDLQKLTTTTGFITKYVDPCSADQLDSQEEIHDRVGELLTQYGFDVPDNW